MNCQHINANCLLEALHDGALPPETAAALRAHLAACPACRAQLATLEQLTAQLARLPTNAESATPSERMRAHFHAMLAAGRHEVEAASRRFSESESGKKPLPLDAILARLFPRRPVHQFAAALALLALGLLVGARYLAPNSQSTELAELREHLKNTDRLVTYSLLQQKTTSERLQSVLATMQLKTPDRQLLTDLVGALALDPSVNVRLTVVEALAPHANERIVRAGLLAALPRETAPLVQAALIDLLASTRDATAAPAIAQLARNTKTDPSVREIARRALAFLNNAPPPDTAFDDTEPLPHTT